MLELQNKNFKKFKWGLNYCKIDVKIFKNFKLWHILKIIKDELKFLYCTEFGFCPCVSWCFLLMFPDALCYLFLYSFFGHLLQFKMAWSHCVMNSVLRLYFPLIEPNESMPAQAISVNSPVFNWPRSLTWGSINQKNWERLECQRENQSQKGLFAEYESPVTLYIFICLWLPNLILVMVTIESLKADISSVCPFDERLTFKTSAFKLYTVAKLP